MNTDPPLQPPPSSPDGKRYLFSGGGPGSALEELRSIFEKKLRTSQRLGEEDTVRAYREAYQMAQKWLGASVGEDPEALQENA